MKANGPVELRSMGAADAAVESVASDNGEVDVDDDDDEEEDEEEDEEDDDAEEDDAAICVRAFMSDSLRHMLGKIMAAGLARS